MANKTLMILSNEYRPDPRVEKEAKALLESGIAVTIISWDRERRHPLEKMDGGIGIDRVQTGIIKKKTDLAKNYVIFLLKALRKAKKHDYDFVHAHDFDTLLPGVLIARLNGKKLIYDAHEHYARMVEDDIPHIVVPLLDMAEARMVRLCDRVIAANQMIAEYLQPNVRNQITVIMNCIDPPETLFNKMEKDFLTVFYGGALEPQRYILEVASCISHTSGVRMRIAGKGSLQSKVEELARSCNNIDYLGYIDHEKMMIEIASADLVLALLDPCNENNRIGTPNRLFEAMALGTPVLASDGTLSGRIVREEDSGYVVKWSDFTLIEILSRLKKPGEKERIGSNGIRAVKEHYNWKKMGHELVSLYDEIKS